MKKTLSPSRSPWARFRRDRRAVACLAVLCLEVLAVVPVGYPAFERQVKDRFHSERVHIGDWGHVLKPKTSYVTPEYDDVC